MQVLLRGVAGLLLLLATPSLGGARCGDDPGDADAVARARTAADAACDAQQSGCSTASDHGRYVHCVAMQANVAVHEGRLRPACKRAVTRCAARSTCGRPGAVTCCRTKAGETRCGIRSGRAECIAPGGGTACAGTFPSCCDACGTSGCAGSTTTSTTATTTSTTLQCHFDAASNGCQGGCPRPGGQCALVAPGACDCPLPGCHTCWLTVDDVCTDMPCSSDADCRTEPNTLCLEDKCDVPCPSTTTSTNTTTTTITGVHCGDFPDCNGACPDGARCARNFDGPECRCFPADVTPCFESGFPECGGSCLDGKVCQAARGTDGGETVFEGCACVAPVSVCGQPPDACSFGVCPPGEECVSDVFPGRPSPCQTSCRPPTTTTTSTTSTTVSSTSTTTAPPCASGGYPTCDGGCVAGERCEANQLTLACECVPDGSQPCTQSAAYFCNGTCGAGEQCGMLSIFGDCGCVAAGSTPCGEVGTACGVGSCPTGESCGLLSTPSLTYCTCAPTGVPCCAGGITCGAGQTCSVAPGTCVCYPP